MIELPNLFFYERGSSGAQIRTYDAVVVKSGSPREGAQGAWILRHRRHTDNVLPDVYQVRDTAYDMERLTIPPYWFVDREFLLRKMIALLADQLWSRPAEVELDPIMHVDKVETLLNRYASAQFKPLTALRESIDWPALQTCLTHGDPTWDNVMFRPPAGQLVLLDPVPATPAVPDLRCVDTGKLLQSALGYECQRYADVGQSFVEPTYLRHYLRHQFTRRSDLNEWRATVYWAAVHVLRALPYMPTEVHRNRVGGLVGKALDLL